MDYIFTVFRIIKKEYNFNLNDKILIIILLSLMGCDYHNKNNEYKKECIVSDTSLLSVSYTNNLEFSKKLEKFNGCEELNTTAIQIVNDHKNSWYYDDMIDPPYCSGAAISNSENLNSDDNKNNPSFQESNVSELDLYQIKDNVLIISKGNGIELVNKNTLSPIQSLTFENIKNIKLFLYNDRLIAIGNINENNIQGNFYQGIYNFKSYTIIKVFKVHPTHLQELYHKKILGELKVARLLKTGQLTIITHKNLLSLQSSNINSNDETSFSFPWSHNSDEFDQVNCNNYFKPIISNNETSITNISTFDINNLNWQNKKAIFGSFDPIYITEKNINLFKYSYTKPLLPENSSSNTAMVSLNLTDLEPVSPILTIKGNLNDRWSVKSLNNGKNIAIATSVRKKVSNPDDPNILFSMRDNEFTIYQTPKDTESDWTINSKISNFAINEDIRSVRFLDNKAFIVTFRKTDPLFMIDLSNPNDAKIISQLKIPGFSTYLQPFKNNQLIGVGFDTKDESSFSWFAGVKLSMFDYSNPNNIIENSNSIIGIRGSFSDAQFDPQALYANEKNNIIALPVIEYQNNYYNGVNSNPLLPEYRPIFSGAILYSTIPNLREVKRISHREWIPSNCENTPLSWWQSPQYSQDIQRIISDQNNIISLSRYGVKLYKFQNEDFKFYNKYQFDNTQKCN